MREFRLSCESTIDLPYSYTVEHNLPVLFYSYSVDGTAYEDDMGKDPANMKHFWEMVDAGKLPSTSQVNTYLYEDYFRDLLSQGKDVLHIAFGSGLTPSVRNAYEAADKVRDEYPDRKLVVVDTVCASAGYGLIVDIAVEMRDNGASMDEIEQWLLENRTRIRHEFYTTDMSFFRRSGRVSGPTALIASVLNICPMMHLNLAGKIIAYGKVRGKKAAEREILNLIEKHAVGGLDYSGKVFISNADCKADAQEMAELIEAKFTKLKAPVQISDIGCVIASHTGRGTVAVFFQGDEREEE